MEELLKSIENLRSTVIGNIIFTIILYSIIVFIGIKITDKLTDRWSKKSGKSALLCGFAKQVIRGVFILIGVLGIISSIPSLDKFTTTVVASSSLLVAAIGLAAQETLANAINGLIITIFKPFVVGDRVRLVNQGITGFIEDINLRHTTIRTFENNRIMIPNTSINKDNIENFSFKEERVCNYIDFNVRYTTDFELAKLIIEDVIEKHPMFYDTRTEEEIQNGTPAINVLIRGLLDNGIQLRVGVWSKTIGDSFKYCSDIRSEVLKEFKKNEVEIAIPVIQINK